MKVDPAASLAMTDITVQACGEVFVVPALPASEWIPLLAQGDLAGIVDIVRPEGEGVGDSRGFEDFEDLLLSGRMAEGVLSTLLTEIVEAVAGRPVTAAVGLAVTAYRHWAVIGGELALRGFRWDITPLGAALDAIYAVITSRLSPEELRRFDSALSGRGAARHDRGGGGHARSDVRQALKDFEALAGPPPAGPPPPQATGVQSGGGQTRSRRQSPPPLPRVP